MGKVIGLIGSVSGKVGNVVYSVQNGIQIARVYNPSVSNPKSEEQTKHRAKMSLAGRLQSIIPIEAILGMPGANKRAKRGAFVADVIRNATNFDGESAKIQPVDLVFSKGSIQVMERTITVGVTKTGNNIANVTVTMTTGAQAVSLRPAGYHERLVILAVNSATSQYDYCQVADAAAYDDQYVSTTTVRFYVQAEYLNDYRFLVYAIPYVNTAEVNPSSYSYLGYNEGVVVNVGNSSSVIPTLWGRSVYEGLGQVPVSLGASPAASSSRKSTK